jgi:hypothetical protein
MNYPTVDELSARMTGQTDLELLRSVTVDASDYSDDALEAARAELRRRGRTVPSTREFLTSFTPDELKASDLFCFDCHESTTSDRFPATGEIFQRKLLSAGDGCTTCGAVVREHYQTVFWIPLYCLARYRVKQLQVPWPGTPKIVASRKIREA